MKVEELESTNQSLTKLCEGRKSLLAQKASNMTQMEAELFDAKDRFDGVQEDLNRLRRDSAMVATTTLAGENGGGNRRTHRAPPSHGTNTTDGREEEEGRGDSEEITKLRGSAAELSLKLQNSTFQKNRLERELEGVLSENALLAKNLERAEADLAEMHVRYDEMLSENHALDSASVTSPSCTTPLSPSSSLTAVRNNIRPPQMEPTTRGQSLFSELGSEFGSLPEHTPEFLRNSTISATTTLTQQGGGANGNETTPSVQVRVQGKSSGTFKELFDEMFATLRQTAKVADRLIERRSDGQ